MRDSSTSVNTPGHFPVLPAFCTLRIVFEIAVGIGISVAFIWGMRAFFDHMVERANAAGLFDEVAQATFARVIRREIERSVRKG